MKQEMLMESKPRKQDLKKKLAIATMAASLGVSLGVPVGDVLADDAKASSPPGYSRQDKDNAASVQTKLSNQTKMSDQGKIESVQGKFKSNQGKVESGTTDLTSSQGKVGYKVETKSEPVKK
jgi:peptidoglycan hydrolase CwlO-like protein